MFFGSQLHAAAQTSACVARAGHDKIKWLGAVRRPLPSCCSSCGSYFVPLALASRRSRLHRRRTRLRARFATSTFYLQAKMDSHRERQILHHRHLHGSHCGIMRVVELASCVVVLFRRGHWSDASGACALVFSCQRASAVSGMPHATSRAARRDSCGVAARPRRAQMIATGVGCAISRQACARARPATTARRARASTCASATA